MRLNGPARSLDEIVWLIPFGLKKSTEIERRKWNTRTLLMNEKKMIDGDYSRLEEIGRN